MTPNKETTTFDCDHQPQGSQPEDQILYPEKDNKGREGLFCVECGSIFYVAKEYLRRVSISPCPICSGGSEAVLWILEDCQPFTI